MTEAEYSFRVGVKMTDHADGAAWRRALARADWVRDCRRPRRAPGRRAEVGMTPELKGRMWGDLFVSEVEARAAVSRVTFRAMMYVDSGMPIEKVLDALQIDQCTWDSRVAAVLRTRQPPAPWMDRWSVR